MSVAEPDLLDAIVAAARTRVAAAQIRRPRAELERAALARVADGPAFLAALARPNRINIVAECKRRSPSRGVLRAAYDPVTIARGYERAAAAISVVTEPGFFDGSIEHLAAVRAAVGTPLLRKDFIVDDYQLTEARAAGADAVLLIVAALTDQALRRLLVAAGELGLAVVVEVHTLPECDRALDAGARIVGVNNRNLRTLVVDHEASRTVAGRLPKEVVAISESGLKTAADLREMASLGYRAFLIGERLMVEPDPGRALTDLLRTLGPGGSEQAS